MTTWRHVRASGPALPAWPTSRTTQDAPIARASRLSRTTRTPVAARPARYALAALLSLLSLLAAGCAAPPDHYHTLRPAGAGRPVALRSGNPNAAGTLEASPRGPGARAEALAIGPVTVPESLSRNEWLVRVGETGVLVYDHQLWTQGLAAEIAQALADQLNDGAVPEAPWADAGPTGSGTGADLARTPRLRARVQVLRFDSILAPSPAVDDALSWTLECLPSDPTLSPVEAGRFHALRSGLREVGTPAPQADPAVDADQQRYDRIARAHAQALRALAGDLSAALRDSTAERAQACVAQAP